MFSSYFFLKISFFQSKGLKSKSDKTQNQLSESISELESVKSNTKYKEGEKSFFSNKPRSTVTLHEKTREESSTSLMPVEAKQ